MLNMQTVKVNGFEINLPVGLPEVLDTPVRDSYQTFLRTSTNDVRRHLTCATTLLPPMMKGMDGASVLHAFGGLGATAQILDNCATDLEHTFWERDPVCLDFLRDHYENVLKVDDSFELFPQVALNHFDILLMDMSVGTIKTKGVKKMWSHIASWIHGKPDRFVWFTDTACHKIHLNWKSYYNDFGSELDSPTAEAYLHAYCRWMEERYRMTVQAAMREAGEIYAIVVPDTGDNRFSTIPYV